MDNPTISYNGGKHNILLPDELVIGWWYQTSNATQIKIDIGAKSLGRSNVEFSAITFERRPSDGSSFYSRGTCNSIWIIENEDSQEKYRGNHATRQKCDLSRDQAKFRPARLQAEAGSTQGGTKEA